MKKLFMQSLPLAWALVAALGLGLAATAQADDHGGGTVKATVTKTGSRVGSALETAFEATKRGVKRAGVAVTHAANRAGSSIKKILPDSSGGAEPSRVNPDAARDSR